MPFPPEAATPHAPLSLPESGALTPAPGIDRPRVFGPRRRAAVRWRMGSKHTPSAADQGTFAWHSRAGPPISSDSEGTTVARLAGNEAYDAAMLAR
jgi:hypothetical protein